MTQTQAFNPQTPPVAPQRKSSWFKYCLFGCLGIALISVLVCGGGLYFVTKNARSLTSGAITGIARAAVNETPIPSDQKTRINAQLDRVSDEFVAKRLSMEQVGSVLETIVQSPEFAIGAAYYTAKSHILKSTLDASAKTEAQSTFMRLVHGYMEDTIDDADFQSVIAPLYTSDANGNQKFKSTLPTGELILMIQSAREVVEAAGVPMDVLELDVATTVERSVDDMLSQDAAQP